MWSYAKASHFFWDPSAFPIGPQAQVSCPSSARCLGACPQAAAALCISLLFNQSRGDGSGVSGCCKSWLAVWMRHALLPLSV